MPGSPQERGVREPWLWPPLRHAAGSRGLRSPHAEAAQRSSGIVPGAGLQGHTGWQGRRPPTRPILLKSEGRADGLPRSRSPPGPRADRAGQRRAPRSLGRASAAPP